MNQSTFKEFVLDQLPNAGSIDCKAMFGGFGLYRNGIFFAIIARERLYFKTDVTSRTKYTDAGMGRGSRAR
ncbi:MAG: TfoX/Sxy family protein [Candidatus Omnitrophota bacterium]|nr:TfoX/Sxy family protein [Candidatus Omnitrophota bacterium]